MIKRMVLAWDRDFTKLTSTERQRLEFAEQEIETGETVEETLKNVTDTKGFESKRRWKMA